MKRPERVWQQYHGKAEAEAIRGSGIWPLQTHPCELEPPFDRYDRRVVNAWDCVCNDWEASWEGSWLHRVLSTDTPVHSSDEYLQLVEVALPSTDDLVPIVIEQFAEDESTIPKAEQLLRSLPNLSRPVSFEILGVGGLPLWDHELARLIAQDNADGKERRSITDAIPGWGNPYTICQFVAHRDDARRLERLLVAHYPNSAVRLGDSLNSDHDELPAREINWGGRFGATLSMHHYYCWPLRTFGRLDPDPLGVAIAAMDDLEQDEWALLQILFQPARWNWPDNLRAAIHDPYKDEIMLPDVTEVMLRTKFNSPLFAVSIRIASSRKDVFHQLEGWAEQFANPPQAFWANDTFWEEGAMTEDEAHTLSLSLGHRCTFRPGILLNVEELSSLVHLPSNAVVSDRLRQVKSRTRPAPETKYDDGSMLIGVNTHRGKTRNARIASTLRERHCYIAGASGTGKSTLLLNMIVQDIVAGRGVGLLDPHGDLVNAVLQRIPDHRIDDVILFDPTDDEFPFALNILEAKDEKERERIVAEMLMALMRYFPGSWGPRLERILTFTLYTVLEAIPGATLADVERMLIDDDFRSDVIAAAKTPRYIDFWIKEYAYLPKNSADPVLNKLSVFLLNRTIRNIICQRRSAVDFDGVLSDSKIFLANLSTGILTERFSGTLGSFLVTKIVSAAFRRARVPEIQRRPWYLYVDEFQSFMDSSLGFETILAEARKYKLVLAGLANQYVGQLTPVVRQAIFGNIGTMICFRLGTDDANLVAKEMGVFTSEEILNLELGQAIARAGGSSTSFNLTTAPAPPVASTDPSATIRRLTRQNFCRPQGDVEKEVTGDHTTSEPDEQYSSTDQPRGSRSQRTKQSPRSHENPHPPDHDPSEDDFVT